MKRKLKYDWKIIDFIYNLFRIFSLLCFCCKRKNTLNIRKRLELYDRGEAKFIKEFDAVYYAKSIRNLTTLVTSMIDENERFMITYQKCNSIPLESDTSSSNSDKNDAIPKTFDKERLKHQKKVNDFMVL